MGKKAAPAPLTGRAARQAAQAARKVTVRSTKPRHGNNVTGNSRITATSYEGKRQAPAPDSGDSSPWGHLAGD